MADNQETLRQQTARQIKAREAEIERFGLSLEKFLKGNLKSLLKKLKTDSPKEAAIYLGSLLQALQEGGLQEQVAQLERIFTNELAAIRLDFEASAKKEIRFSDTDLTDVETLINFQEDRIFSTINNLVDDTKATLLEAIMSGTPPNLDEILENSVGRTAANINTELNTAVMSFNRSIQISKAEEFGLELFIYIGPDDAVTREFCEEVLDGSVDGLNKSVPIYTKEEINAMDNGQGLPVATSGGGYNCRHHWRPVTLEFAKRLGYDD